MKHVCVITVNHAVHEMINGSINPSAKLTGKGIRLIYGDSEEECIELLNKFLKSNNISSLEDNNVNQNRRKKNG